ncbi:MAG: ComEC/Rec2 family competence protein [bacterium]|nr:ComEC/Rec2 family competence protein [bacterium]
MTTSKIFLYFCLSFIGGIFLNSFLSLSLYIIMAGLIFGLIFISVLFKYKKLVVIGFCFLFLVLGIWRHQQVELTIMNNELRKYNDLDYNPPATSSPSPFGERAPQEITLVGLVSAEPDIRDTHTKLTIGNIQLGEDENGSRSVDGKILVTAEKYPGYKYGDKLKIIGKLKTPQIFDEFNYKDYLAKDGIYSVMYYPGIELAEKNQGNFLYAKILSFKDKLREVIYQNLSPPQSSILAAIILGDKRQISQEWKDKLNYAGVRHLTAISGMHVAILTVILMSFLIGLGFWRQQAFYFSIILIFLFIVMTGFQPSAIRAGIMGGLFLLAQYLGRLNVSSRAIVFAATLMLVHNPLLLKLDVGFQLSFLAMMGIIYLVPIFQNLLHKAPDFLQREENKFSSSPFAIARELKNISIMTISAQVFTLPILIYNFGYFSAIAPLTNVLVVPLLPFIMGLGFIFTLAGAVWSYFGWFFSLPVWLLLTYLIKIVDWFSGFSFSAFVFEISWLWLLIAYLILGLFIWWVNKKQKLKFLKY